MDGVFAALLEAAEEAAEGRGAQLTSPRVQQLRRHEQAKWGSGCHGGSLVARRRRCWFLHVGCRQADRV